MPILMQPRDGMPCNPKDALIEGLRRRFGEISKLPGGNSLFSIGNDAARIYFRYSKVHEKGRTFFGLRSAKTCSKEVVDRLMNLFPQVEAWFKDRTVGEHVEALPILIPVFPEKQDQ
jgi:hypothetical protein